MKVITYQIIIIALTLSLVACTGANYTAQSNSSRELNASSSLLRSQLLFVSNQDGDREIYAVDHDGSHQQQLTFNHFDDYDASWSPAGDKILFTSSRDQGNSEIYLMNADGSEQTNLSNHSGVDGRARWSPDGDKIVFNSDRNGTESLFLLSLATGGISPLTVEGLTMAAEAAWSPDGNWIAFQGFNQYAKSDVWLMSGDGAQAMQLTDNPKSEDSPVSWSPDGRKLLYHSRRNYQYNIYIYDLERQQEFQITHLSTSDIYPKWSHDGKSILFLSTRGQLGRTQLCLMQEDGSQQRCLTDERYQTADAVWREDDQGIFHTNWLGTRYSNIFLLDVNNNQLTAVSPAQAFQSQPLPRPVLLPNN